MKLRLRLALLAGALVIASAANAVAQINELPRELQGVGIEERPGAQIPRDVQLRDQDGKSVRFGDLLDGERPVMLVFAYFRCPMLCSMVLNGLSAGLKELAWTPGKEFRVVTVSIDPTDTVEMAAAKRTNQLEAFARKPPDHGWDFFVGSEAEVKRLADAVGFHYRYDESQKQYAHAAGAFLVTTDGRLSRTLYGITFPERSLRLGLVEASEGKMGGAWDKVLLLCFHYDPAAKGYVLFARRMMRLGGLLTLLVLALILRRGFRAMERDRDDARGTDPRTSAPSEDPV